MKGKTIRVALFVGVFVFVLVALSLAAQDRYTLKVPNGLAFSEFRGYEDWQVIAPSQTDAQNVMRVILANPVMIRAYRAGIPANGKPFPDGSKIAKIEWRPRKITDAPFSATTPDTVPGILTEDTPCSTMTLRPIRSRPAPWPASRRRGTTPSAGPHAIS